MHKMAPNLVYLCSVHYFNYVPSLADEEPNLEFKEFEDDEEDDDEDHEYEDDDEDPSKRFCT